MVRCFNSERGGYRHLTLVLQQEFVYDVLHLILPHLPLLRNLLVDGLDRPAGG